MAFWSDRGKKQSSDKVTIPDEMNDIVQVAYQFAANDHLSAWLGMELAAISVTGLSDDDAAALVTYMLVELNALVSFQALKSLRGDDFIVIAPIMRNDITRESYADWVYRKIVKFVQDRGYIVQEME